MYSGLFVVETNSVDCILVFILRCIIMQSDFVRSYTRQNGKAMKVRRKKRKRKKRAITKKVISVFQSFIYQIPVQVLKTTTVNSLHPSIYQTPHRPPFPSYPENRIPPPPLSLSDSASHHLTLTSGLLLLFPLNHPIPTNNTIKLHLETRKRPYSFRTSTLFTEMTD